MRTYAASCFLLAACSSAPASRSDPVQTRLLSESAFQATCASPMRDVLGTVDPKVDIWPYVAAIPRADLQGHEIAVGSVAHVYRAAGDAYDHVLVPSATANVFLAIVVDLAHGRVLGHHLLDLNAKYGRPTPGRSGKA